MKQFSNLLLTLVLLLPTAAQGQPNFRVGWEKANPVPRQSTLSLAEKTKVHQSYLDDAIQRKDSLQHFYGLIYLFNDQLRANDFPEASRYLLLADKLAKASGSPVWKGWALHRKGVLAIRMNDGQAAIAPYEQSMLLCRKGGDSLCVGENMEQLGAIYTGLDDYEKAKSYFDRAIPLIEKYGNEADLAIALNNVGNFYAGQAHYTEAIRYFERCIAIFQRQSMPKEEVQALSNMANAFRHLKQFDKAIKTYQRCMSINRASNFQDNLLINYSGLHYLYSEKGEYRTAYEYLLKHSSLNDSIYSAETMMKTAAMEAKFENQQKELDLQKSQAALALAKASLERRNWFIFMGLLLVCFGTWRWVLQARRAKQKQEMHQQNLRELTRILLERNTLIVNMEESLAAHNPLSAPQVEQPDFESDLYNQHILTDSDWTAFKGYFEKAHPRFIQRLDTAFPSITNAEKRLFLLIKINLTTKEAATMLGISAESVKKTRTRLRKRLGLTEEVDLEGFIRAF